MSVRRIIPGPCSWNSRFTSSKTPEVSESERQLDKLKFEIAEELQLDDDIKEKGFANMTSRECGQIGGNMVGKMVMG